MHVHTVLVRLRDRDDLAVCVEKMRSMEGRIDGMIALDCRVNELDEPHAYDIALTTTWRDVDAYYAYKTDPVHEAVAEVVRAAMSEAATVDYSVAESE